MPWTDPANGTPLGSTLLVVIVTLVLLVALQRWIHQHLHGLAYLLTHNRKAAVLLYAVPLFPGVMLHELSHWLMAKLLRVKTGGVSLLPKRDRNGYVRLGSVTIERADVIRASLIGLAPLISGCIVVMYLGYRMFEVETLGSAVLSGDVIRMVSAFVAVFRVPDMWLWLYLLFAVANAMLPSPSDRETWPPVLVFLGVLIAIAYLLGGGRVLLDLAPLVVTGLRWLAVTFIVTLGVDIPFALLITLAEWLVGSISGHRIEYRGVDK